MVHLSLSSLVVAMSLLLSPTVVGACAAWLCPPAEVHHSGHGAAGTDDSQVQASVHAAGHHASHQHHEMSALSDDGRVLPVVAAVPTPDCCTLAATTGTVLAPTPRSELTAVPFIAVDEAVDVMSLTRAGAATAPPEASGGPPPPTTTIRILRI